MTEEEAIRSMQWQLEVAHAVYDAEPVALELDEYEQQFVFNTLEMSRPVHDKRGLFDD